MKSVTTLGASCLVPSHFLYDISKQKVRWVFSRRYYSTLNSESESESCGRSSTSSYFNS